MRTSVLAVAMLVFVGVAAAQTPGVKFGYYRCSCQAGSPAFVPTPSVFGPASTSGWQGAVYALSDSDAKLKAKGACIAENRGNQFICDTCLCR